ncbi:hypothetical protein [Paraburkholderia sp. 32]|uniref:hypothetical protein n=1 Tax=Paraburkholderia sp. 32 TaxID=2991057 RepID=UPI003D251043
MNLMMKREITVRELTKLKALASKLPEAVVVISVLRDHFTQKEIELLKKFVKEGLQKSWHCVAAELSCKQSELGEEQRDDAAWSWSGSVNEAHSEAGISR